MKREYEVEIDEYLHRHLIVEAESAKDAFEKVYDDYRNQHIVLDSRDFEGCCIKTYTDDGEDFYEKEWWV